MKPVQPLLCSILQGREAKGEPEEPKLLGYQKAWAPNLYVIRKEGQSWGWRWHRDSGGDFGGSAAKSLYYKKICSTWNEMMGNESEGWVLMQALSLTRQVSLNKWHYLSQPQFPHLSWGWIDIWITGWDDQCEANNTLLRNHNKSPLEMWAEPHPKGFGAWSHMWLITVVV